MYCFTILDYSDDTDIDESDNTPRTILTKKSKLINKCLVMHHLSINEIKRLIIFRVIFINDIQAVFFVINHILDYFSITCSYV